MGGAARPEPSEHSLAEAVFPNLGPGFGVLSRFAGTSSWSSSREEHREEHSVSHLASALRTRSFSHCSAEGAHSSGRFCPHPVPWALQRRSVWCGAEVPRQAQLWSVVFPTGPRYFLATVTR